MPRHGQRHGHRQRHWKANVKTRRIKVGDVEPAPPFARRRGFWETTRKQKGYWGDVPVHPGDRCYILNGIQLCINKQRPGDRALYWNILYCPKHLANLPRGRACEHTAGGYIDYRYKFAHINHFFAEVRERHLGARLEGERGWARGRGLGGYTYSRLMPWLKKQGVKWVGLEPMDERARSFWEHMGFEDAYEKEWDSNNEWTTYRTRSNLPPRFEGEMVKEL